jgi:hypothetical protein
MGHLSVQTKVVSSSKSALLHSKQVQLLSFLSMNKRMFRLLFLNKGSTVIFFIYFYRHCLYHSVLHFFVLFGGGLGIPFASLNWILANPDELSPNYS